MESTYGKFRRVGVNDYRALAEFRYQIRKFLRFSERGGPRGRHRAAASSVDAGAERDCQTAYRPRWENLPERLQIQHHSSVELINRLSEQGLVQRRRSEQDRRQVLVALTARGERTLRELSIHHREELQAIAPQLIVRCGALSPQANGAHVLGHAGACQWPLGGGAAKGASFSTAKIVYCLTKRSETPNNSDILSYRNPSPGR